MRLYLFVFMLCAAPEGAAQGVDLYEVDILRATFSETVSSATVEEEYSLWVCRDALIRLRAIESASEELKSQYFVYADRNPARQRMLVAYLDVVSGLVHPIGWDRISTGNPKRTGHFVTPTGVFANSTHTVGYRALGTKNSRGWRGLGAKGSRVWDFGWQWTDHHYAHHSEQREIRLLMHATDPTAGELRLGKVDSKGCVRISAKLNTFLDCFGILDCDYEQEADQFSWLLKDTRQPVHSAGRYLVVGDSQYLEELPLIVKTPL